MRQLRWGGLSCSLFFLILLGGYLTGLSNSTLAATVVTDRPDYAPGETVVITGSGFAASESVTVRVTHVDTTIIGGAGHDPWTVKASPAGGFTTYWVVPFDDNVGQTLKVTATGKTSGLVATTTFNDVNSKITITSIPSTVVAGDTFMVTARLVQNCGGAVDSPLVNRTVLFFLTEGNCGNDVGQVAPDSDQTDANGFATGKLVIPFAGSWGVRVKYRGEDKPDPCPTPGNSACDPFDPAANKRCVDISSSNDCKGIQAIACTPPVITCPNDTTVCNGTGQCSRIVNYPSPTTTAGCGPVTVACTPASGSAFPVGMTTVTCIASDTVGKKDTCTFKVTVNDCQKPTITCPANIVKPNDPGQCCAVTTFAPTVSDNCPGVTFVCTPASGFCFPVGVTTVKCIVTDAASNKDSCTFTVTVNDTQKPTITCPAPIVKPNDPGQCCAVATFAPTFSDNCPGATVVCTPASGFCFPVGVTTVKCIVTDASSNKDSCTFTVTVNDTQKPTITCPAPIVKPNDPGQCCAVATFTPTIGDNCPNPTFVCTPASGFCFPVGVTTVKCIVTDASSNKDSCTFTVTVNDTQKPTIVCPADSVKNADAGQCCAVEVFAPTVNDNCPGATFVCTPASGFCFPVGMTTVKCVATDAAGNKDSCTFKVTVNDNIKPTITCPADIVKNNDPGQCCAVTTFAPTVSDNCPGVTFVCTPASGFCFPVGVTTVKCIVTDAASNKDSCTFTVTVNDTQKPTITCPAPIVKPNDPGQCCAVATFAPTVSDNCPGVTFVCTPASGFCFPVGMTTVKCVATDAAGNKDSCTFKVTVNDNIKPTITCPADIVKPNDPGQCCVVATFTPTVSDNCPGATFVCTPPSGTCFPVGMTTVKCVVTDAAGNKDSCTFKITVNDTQKPTITCPADIAKSTDPGKCCAVATFSPTINDNCPGATVVCTPASGFCFPVGMTTVKCVVTDAASNKDSCTFKVTVNNGPPILSFPGGKNRSINLCESICFPVKATDPEGDSVTITKLSAEGGLSCPPQPKPSPDSCEFCFTPTVPGLYRAIFRAADKCGNMTTDTVVITVNNERLFVEGPRDSSLFLCAGDTIKFQVCAHDCDTLTLTKECGPGTFPPERDRSPVCGTLTFVPPSSGLYTWCFKAVDRFGAMAVDTVRFNVTVNSPPNISVTPSLPETVTVGDTVCFTVTGTDIDAGDIVTLTVSPPGFQKQCSPPGPNRTCTFCVTSSEPGTFCLVFKAADNCGATALDTVCITFQQCFRFVIDTATAFLGQHSVVLCVNNVVEAFDPSVTPNPSGVGGFNFLFAYDPTCLTFQKAEMGQFLKDCQWEFFTFRFGTRGNCGTCPSGFIRVIGIADINDALQHHPPASCFHRNAGQWICLFFEVTRDRTFQNTCCPVRWAWEDCTDNTVSDSTGNFLWVVDSVYNAHGVPIDLATEYGIGVDVSNCVSSGGPGKPQTIKCIVFKDGKICIPADSSIDARGDINLNGIPNEIADAVLHENCLLYGMSALSSDPLRRQAQIAASDVNNDGLDMTVADLVYQLRIITGDAQPFPKPAGGASPDVTIDFAERGGELFVASSNRTIDLGGLLLVLKVNGQVKDVVLTGRAGEMGVRFAQTGDQLRILIDTYERGKIIAAGTGEILKITGVRSAEFVEAQASNRGGYPVTIELAKSPVPTQFSLFQNRPNPFNPTTRITLALPVASDYRLVIYNVAGQVVRTFAGQSEAGEVNITWDGTDENGNKVASGIYFYRGAAGTFSATKKMVLIK